MKNSIDPLPNVRVLVVDDEPDNREIVMMLLSDLGAIVEVAGSAAEGFDLLRTWRPDVIVSDIGMPDEDGFSFMRRVRALSESEGGSVPSLALTALTSVDDRRRGLAAGFTAYMTKPADPKKLASTVADLAAPRRADA